MKIIRLKEVKGGGSKTVFIVSNITCIKPCDDNNSLVITTANPKGVKVYESADEIAQMIELETVGQQPQSSNPVSYPQLENNNEI